MSSASPSLQPNPPALVSELPASALHGKLSSIFSVHGNMQASADGVRNLIQNFDDHKFMAMLSQSPTTTLTLLECLAKREFEGRDKDIGRTAVREFLTTPLAVWKMFDNHGVNEAAWNEVGKRLFSIVEDLDCHGVTAILCAPHVAKTLAFFHQGEQLAKFLKELPVNCLERLNGCEEFHAAVNRYGFLRVNPI